MKYKLIVILLIFLIAFPIITASVANHSGNLNEIASLSITYEKDVQSTKIVVNISVWIFGSFSICMVLILKPNKKKPA